MRRFILDLVLPCVGLLGAAAVLRDRLYAWALLWVWLPLAVVLRIVGQNKAEWLAAELLFGTFLAFAYILVWGAVAAFRAWRVPGEGTTRVPGLLLVVLLPFGIVPVTVFLSNPAPGLARFSLYWLVAAIAAAIVWKNAAQRALGPDQSPLEVRTDAEDETMHSGWPLWLVGLPLLLPAAAVWVSPTGPGPTTWLSDSPVLLHYVYGWFRAACMYGYVGLVMWPSGSTEPAAAPT